MGFIFSVPQEGLIREVFIARYTPVLGGSLLRKLWRQNFAASKYHMSTVTCKESVSQIMTMCICIDINKARSWIFYIMVSQENLELYPFCEKTSFLKCT